MHLCVAGLRSFTAAEVERAISHADATELSRGSYGRVYKASIHGQQVAIKVLEQVQPDLARLAFKEAAAMSTVHHPNLLEVIGYCMEAP